MKPVHALILAVCLTAAVCRAQGPHEVLLLVNANSKDSVEVASCWARMRDVPKQNIVLLDLPARYDKGELEISLKDFTELIWEPSVKAVESRGIGHVMAWVYSTGFPVLVRSKPEVSILGLTYLRNRVPGEAEVRNAKYKSPLFAGRDSATAPAHFPKSLYSFRSLLMDQMPLPCMMLGYIGKNGNTKEEVLKCIKNGVAADGSFYDGDIYFVESDDVRTEARKWQFPIAVNELKELGVKSSITNVFPSNVTNVLGIMAGTASLDADSGNTYLSGAMTEHLTSAGAVFSNSSQTKISEWIRAGATASSGTIVEPYAIWAKFPDARFFVYYASGCTMLESFYQSVRCPLQLLILGEPLAQPWLESAELSVDGLEAGREVETIELSADVKSSSLSFYGKVVYLVDGRIVKKGKRIELAAKDHEQGKHSLRVVAYRTGMVRQQVYKTFMFEVKGGVLKFIR